MTTKDPSEQDWHSSIPQCDELMPHRFTATYDELAYLVREHIENVTDRYFTGWWTASAGGEWKAECLANLHLQILKRVLGKTLLEQIARQSRREFAKSLGEVVWTVYRRGENVDRFRDDHGVLNIEILETWFRSSGDDFEPWPEAKLSALPTAAVAIELCSCNARILINRYLNAKPGTLNAERRLRDLARVVGDESMAGEVDRFRRMKHADDEPVLGDNWS